MYTTIIASLPGEPLILDAVASIAAQTLPASRVIVICDAGAPLPHEWKENIRDLHPNVELARNTEPGMVAALNMGIALSRTTYLSFLDADDLWQTEKQERQIALLEQDLNLDVVTCRGANFRVGACEELDFHPPAATILFTASTFRLSAFERFGRLDSTSTHFTWLYRWWGDARARGINTRSIDYVGLHRRLHDRNSWSVRSDEAHRDLLSEIRHRVNKGREGR